MYKGGTKRMKKISLILMSLLIVLLMGFVACGPNPDTPNEPGTPNEPNANGLVGKWENGDGDEVEFKADGKWTYGNETGDSYELEGNVLELMNDDSVEEKMSIALSGDELIIHAFYGDGNTETLVGEWKMQVPDALIEQELSFSLEAGGTGTMSLKIGATSDDKSLSWEYDSSQKKWTYTVDGQEESQEFYIYIVGNGFTRSKSADKVSTYVYKKQN